jgi:hypothetical protein
MMVGNIKISVSDIIKKMDTIKGSLNHYRNFSQSLLRKQADCHSAAAKLFNKAFGNIADQSQLRLQSAALQPINRH